MAGWRGLWLAGAGLEQRRSRPLGRSGTNLRGNLPRRRRGKREKGLGRGTRAEVTCPVQAPGKWKSTNGRRSAAWGRGAARGFGRGLRGNREALEFLGGQGAREQGQVRSRLPGLGGRQDQQRLAAIGRPCRLEPRAHRRAEERAGLRGGGRCRLPRLRLFRVRLRRRAAGRRHGGHHPAARADAAAEAGQRTMPADLSAPRPHARGAVRPRRRASSGCACAETSTLVGGPAGVEPPRSARPAPRRGAGRARRPDRRASLAAGDILVLRGDAAAAAELAAREHLAFRDDDDAAEDAFFNRARGLPRSSSRPAPPWSAAASSPA